MQQVGDVRREELCIVRGGVWLKSSELTYVCVRTYILIVLTLEEAHQKTKENK